MLPGGLQHAPHMGTANPRITVAFDIKVDSHVTDWQFNPTEDVLMDLLDGSELPEKQPIHRWDYERLQEAHDNKQELTYNRAPIDYAAACPAH